jgi:hypothetical protein
MMPFIEANSNIRITILIVSITMVFSLGACSMAQDITPPPGYENPETVTSSVVTGIPTDSQQSLTPSPSREPAATSETPAGTLTPSAIPDVAAPIPPENAEAGENTASPSSESNIPVTGQVQGNETNIPSGSMATLMVFDTELGDFRENITAPVNSDGSFAFDPVQLEVTNILLCTIDYGDVSYESSPVQYDGSQEEIFLPISVYESTSETDSLLISQAHLQFDFSTTGQVQVMALYVITNPGSRSVIVPTDGTSIPIIDIPDGATDIDYQLAQSSAPLKNALGGFALQPDLDQQYAIIASFALPYKNRLEYSQAFQLPATSTTVIIPEGVKIRSEQLSDAGIQGTGEDAFHLYQGGSLASGSTLDITISGLPGASFLSLFMERRTSMILVGSVGLLLIGLGIVLFLRDRKLNRLAAEDTEIQEDEIEPEAATLDRISVMDAIIALDDQLTSGVISKDVHAKRRDQLVRKLKDME